MEIAIKSLTSNHLNLEQFWIYFQPTWINQFKLSLWNNGEHTINQTRNIQHLSSETTPVPTTTFVDTLVSKKSVIFTLYSHQIYESLLIELRINSASSVYIIPNINKIYNMIRENRGSMFVNKIHQETIIQ
ncbi:hypothetical protein HZS_3036 [Henneguya salminicola]|nr:hypothetical protein HZS_3036 [Henneguya salminicola]